MADKIGTLEYEMLINEEKLKTQLQEIDKLLKIQDEKWKKALSNVGGGTIGNIDTSKVVTANKKIETSTKTVAGTYKELRAELKLNLKAYEESTQATGKNSRQSKELLSVIRSQKDQLAQLSKSYRQLTIDKRAFNKTELRTEKLKANIDAQAPGTIAKLRAEYALLAFQLGNISTKTPKTVSEIKRLTRAMAENRQQVRALQPTANVWNKLAGAIRTYVTAYLSVQAAIGLGRSVFRQTKELDQLAFSMQTVIQNSTELAKTQKFLSDVAINYGGDLLTLSERYIKFRAAAIQSNVTAKETQQIFDSVSKAAGTLGLKTDELSGVYLALEQMLSKGKVTTEELRRQLGERLPGAFGIMANALGVTIPELDKMLKKGEVLSTEALPKFAAALEKAYGIESLKKIDTLAAAQGRMSTQFTELIRGLNASDFFKDAINGIAGFLGFIKDNISTIGFFSKAILTATVSLTAFRLATRLSNAIQSTSIILFRRQIPILASIDFAQKKAALSARSAAFATTGWARAWNVLKVAFASNPLGVFLVAATTLLSVFTIFRKRTEEVADAITQLNKEFNATKNNIDLFLRSLQSADIGTNEHKEALQGLNTIALKYNETLLTERSSIEEVSVQRRILLDLLDEEYLKKKKIIDYEQATTDLNSVLSPLQDEIYRTFSESEKSAVEAGIAFSKFKDIALSYGQGDIGFYKFRAAVKETLGYLPKDFEEAAKALNDFQKRIIELDAFYKTKDVAPTKVFDLEELKAAKTEFEELARLQKVDGEETLERTYSVNYESYKKYLESVLELDYLTAEQRKAVYLELADLQKEPTGGTGKDPRIESLKAQLSLLEQMKDAYEKLKEYTGADDAQSQVLEAFKSDLERLKFTFVPDLDAKGFENLLNQFADAIEQFDKKFADSIREKIAKNSIEETIAFAKNSLEQIQQELDKATKQDSLKQKIQDITGDEELAINIVYGIDFKGRDVKEILTEQLQEVADSVDVILPDNLTGKFFEQIFDVGKLVDRYGEGKVNLLKSTFENLKSIDEDFFTDALKRVAELQEQFASNEAKKLKIHEEYAKKIADIDSEYFRGSEEEKAIIIENLKQAEKDAIAEIDAVILASTQLYKDLYSDMEYYSKSKIKSIIAQTEDLIESASNAVKGDDGKIRIEIDGSQVPLTEKQIFQLTKQVEKLKKELRENDPFQKISDGFKKITEGGDSAVEGVKMISSGMQDINSLIRPIIDEIGKLAEATGDVRLEELVDDLKIANTWMTLLSDLATSVFEAIITGDPSEIFESLVAVVTELIRAEAEYQKAKKAYLLDNIRLQYEYNNLLIAEQLAFSQGTTIFGSDVIGNVINSMGVYRNTVSQIITATDLLRDRLIITGVEAKKFLGITIGKKNVYSPLLEVYPDLITAEGRLNIERAKALLLTEGLSDQTKVYIQQALDLEMYAKQAYDGLVSYLSGIFGSLGQSLSDSIVNAFENGTNAALEFKDSVSNTLEQLTKDLITSLFLADYFKSFQDKLIEVYSDPTISKDEIGERTIAVMSEFYSGLGGIMDQSEGFLASMQTMGAQYGFDLFNPNDSSQSGLTGAIQSVTEDTARRLEGLINSIRETSINNMNDTSAIMHSNEAIKGYASQSLGHLSTIDSNIALQLALFNDLMSASSVTGKNGLRVVVQ